MHGRDLGIAVPQFALRHLLPEIGRAPRPPLGGTPFVKQLGDMRKALRLPGNEAVQSDDLRGQDRRQQRYGEALEHLCDRLIDRERCRQRYRVHVYDIVDHGR